MLGPNRVIAKYVAMLYLLLLCQIQSKGLVVRYDLVWLGSMIYGMGLWTSARCMVLPLVVVRWLSSSSTTAPQRFIKIHIIKSKENCDLLKANRYFRINVGLFNFVYIEKIIIAYPKIRKLARIFNLIK